MTGDFDVEKSPKSRKFISLHYLVEPLCTMEEKRPSIKNKYKSKVNKYILDSK